MRKFITIFLMLLWMSSVVAEPITVELQNTSLPDAIRLIATALNMNVMISPSVQGSTTLRLKEANAQQTFDLLLMANGLAKWQSGKIWFIAPRAELIKRREEEMKWHELGKQSEPLVSHLWQIHYARADTLAKLLQEGTNTLLSSRGHVRVDQRTNTLYVEDVMGRMAPLQRLIQKLDIPVAQISVRVRLASVDHDCESALGIQFAVIPEASARRQNDSNLFTPALGQYSVAVAKLADHSLLDIKLAALESSGHAELLSSPRLFTANQQTASIEAGEEVPYQETSLSGGTTIAFKKAVLGLKVTPQMLPGNRVLLHLQINQDRASNKLVQGVPTISTRQMTTSVLVKNGQTIVLGGIYETNKEQGERGLPIVSHLPVLGRLLTEHTVHQSKRELLIFVTPTIIRQSP